MKIEVKIMSKDDEIWSLPVEIDEFITNPSEVQFEWENGNILPFNDFIFFGEDYYYGVFINGTNITKIKSALFTYN